MHIHYLVEKGLVIRKVEGKQQVSYFFDWKRFTGKEEDVKELVKGDDPEARAMSGGRIPNQGCHYHV